MCPRHLTPEGSLSKCCTSSDTFPCLILLMWQNNCGAYKKRQHKKHRGYSVETESADQRQLIWWLVVPNWRSWSAVPHFRLREEYCPTCIQDILGIWQFHISNGQTQTTHSHKTVWGLEEKKGMLWLPKSIHFLFACGFVRGFPLLQQMSQS